MDTPKESNKRRGLHLSTQAKLIGVLTVALLAVLVAGFNGLRALRAANNDLKAEVTEQMQPLVDLGSVRTLILENRALLLQAEVDRDSGAAPEVLGRIQANEAGVTALMQSYAARATRDERAALDRLEADQGLWRSAMLEELEALRRGDLDGMRHIEESEARARIATTLNDLTALERLHQAEASTYFQQSVARATFAIRLIAGSVIARVLVAIALGLTLIRAVRRSLQQARDSETKFRSLFELSPVGIALIDLHSGRYLEVNDALVAPTGYSRENLLRMSYRDVMPANDEAVDFARAGSAQDTDLYGPIETQCVRKDGSTYAVLLSGIRMTDAAGRRVVWSIVQDISRRKAMESELIDAAWRDKLTGLPNRALFMERLRKTVERVRQDGRPQFAVLFLDFDHFKVLNDTLGHRAGDELLRQIAHRLRDALDATDAIGLQETGNLIARMGGDEFLILLDDLRTPSDACRIAERLLNNLAPVHQIFGSEVHATASVGIVTSDVCGTSAEEIVRNADVAMYEAKRAGRACSVVFNEAMHVRLTRHAMIETSLRRAIGTPELFLVYQPIIELSSGRMVSVEALARWNHPTLGAVPPSEFIPIAEGSGLIVAIGEWVLTEACQAMRRWLRQNPLRAPKTVSINVSRAELALGARLIERLRSTLRDVDLPAERLQLEVTEREVMRNPKASLEALHGLRDLGVKLAMDDFGTGTSSLAFLSEYPFDTIKIDRSFLKHLTTSRDVLAVIHATVNLVGNLDMICVAEGVEEASQVAVLQSLGCHCGQGYLFSRPVTAEQLMNALESRTEWRPALG
jgi:diguanylate cyclase (GGDEF)-like protein/PAS domain S-box-containing protein